jgi:hypothetical protein
VHAALPAAGWYEPAAHVGQWASRLVCAEPASPKRPGGQALQAVAPAPPSPNCPTAQEMHVPASLVASARRPPPPAAAAMRAYLPARQLSQRTLPTVAANHPSKHVWHSAAPACGEKRPFAHAAHAAAAGGAVAPAVHRAQNEAPGAEA